MLPTDSEFAERQASKIGNNKPVTGYDDRKLAGRNEINLQSRQRRRGRRGGAA